MIIKSLARFVFILFLLLLASKTSPVFAQPFESNAVPAPYTGPYSIKDAQFAIWNGSAYIPVFIKGINMGIAVPGTQPGELAATREDYRRWFPLIKEAGYNTIRLYTLHYPRFYEELRRFNLENPRNPLLLMQGVWLEENVSASDLYNQTEAFSQEIRENVRAVHGDIEIDHRFGKAYGKFQADISPWLIGYLPGREIFPGEVAMTNANNPGETSHAGRFFQLSEADPIEVWLAQRIDSLMIYEKELYNEVRPTGFSSWPTLDPLSHPTEEAIAGNGEDKEQIDLADMVSTDSSGGFFIGYHAYPYYPDFIIQDPHYRTESDSIGPNSYLGYLRDLKAHYKDIPLLIAENGVPSSWGSGHLSPTGMNHGGLSEEETGEIAIRILDNIRESGCAGGFQFSLIDEWFKQTWITNPYSDAQYRHFWHNITAPEQNFGILSYSPPPEPFTQTGSFADQAISGVQSHADYTFFRIRIHMKTEQYQNDTLWIALDTYESSLGESLLPDGTSIGLGGDTLRAEFALQIPLSGGEANLFVIPDYDVFGVKQVVRVDTLVSTASNTGAWNPVRWETNYYYNETQYIGKLKISSSEDPYQFLNAVTIYNDSLDIRLPWTLINYYAPTVRRAMHYVSHMEGSEIIIEQRDSLSEGIALTLSMNDNLYQSERYSWSPWDHEKIAANPPLERKKQSFHFLKRMLPYFNSPPIGLADSFDVRPGTRFEISSQDGLLSNDFDIDGNSMAALLSFGNGAAHGSLSLHPDGSFFYTPDPAFRGEDLFMYYLDDERAFSTLVPVHLNVNFPTGTDLTLVQGGSTIFPNPGKGRFCIEISQPFQTAYVQVYDMMGREMLQREIQDPRTWVELEDLSPGVYLFNLSIDGSFEQHQVILH
ncbi:MAG: Ig-like domain-containing protein [Bacteroides sp.]|nr:Ig-like domain-containing protein [Bacteroides sp.]